MAVKTTIDDYEFIKLLGSGAFAQVYLMRDKSNQKFYAVKKTSKSLLKREGKIEHAFRERELLSSLNHKGIVKLYKAFHDTSSLYLVTEYCSKETLSKLLDRHGVTFPYSLVKYYAAEMVEILSVLRQSNIIHRDIKPENFLITQDNHLKLVDFNCAKKISSRRTMRNTFVGTLSYVAPEIIKNSRTIGHEVDLWSLGCLIYQMIIGKLPFNATSQEEIYENILQGNFCMGNDVPAEAQSLIKSLLLADPESRLGSNSLAELKAHPFFEGINFEGLWDRQVPNVIEEIRKDEKTQHQDSDNSSKGFIIRNNEENKRPYEGVKIIIEGKIQMKKNIFISRNWKMIVTDEPKIKMFSLKTKEERGEIDVKSISNVKTTKTNRFTIVTPKKNYDFTVDNPDSWVSVIRKVMNK
ncbi:hypothetical protein SteCoe_6387 [Stentor coeruleus]|uniref:cAMP-dependent protein kinase n=1 Tax=Stentor coeruleus TaxID=5963 RepID=A0A1R2CQ62_9CILI|nr:hypothetical protein SteCoe_6387 [Stentor coeruleus]